MAERQTLLKEIKDRKKGLINLSRRLRDMDTSIEYLQRLITKLGSRKTKLPNLEDLDDIVQVMTIGVTIGKKRPHQIPGLQNAFTRTVKTLETLRDIFESF